MASVKKYSGVFGALFFLLISIPVLRADDAVLFDDAFFDAEDPLVVADPQEGTVPAAPPTADQPVPAADQPAPPAGQPAPAEGQSAAPSASAAGQPQAVSREEPFSVDLEPRVIPEVVPGQAEPAVEPAAPPAAADAPAPSRENAESLPADSAESEPVPPVESAPAELPKEEKSGVGEEIELVKTLVSPPDSVLGQLRGEPTALSDVLEGVTRPADRKSLTEAYWKLSETLALYHLSLISAGDIEDCITRFTQQGTPSESQTAVLVSARRLAAQRSAEAKVAFVEAQCRLAELRSRNGAAGDRTFRPAIPTDAPNTLSYQTRFDRISREKRLSPQAAYYAEAIPAYYETMTLYDKSAADALEAFRTLYFAGGTSAEILLSAADKLNSAKERLIRSVSAYNKMIAAYVAETVGADVRGQRLISTMIRVPDRSPLPAWDAAPSTRIASAVPIPTQYSPRRPRPVSAEIPQFDSSVPPNAESVVRPSQNAEMLR
ncbi:MAG: hypothetical protein IK105_08010 [Thermoguttaceae bacterium]|nr:hypothetical protein [Thermoguttaceae bacterium]